MVANNDLRRAATEIDRALLEKFSGTTEKVFVFDTEWGHLRALVGSDCFTGMGLSDRQSFVWDYLKSKVPAEHLRFLYGVHPMDLAEYNASVSEA